MAELQGMGSMGSGLIPHLPETVGCYYNVGMLVPTLTSFIHNTLTHIVPQKQC